MKMTVQPPTGSMNVQGTDTSRILKRQSQEGVFAGTLAATPSQTAAQASAPDALTDAENKYFQDLFPSSAAEIRAYGSYQRDGKQMQPAVGGMIDRKG